MSIHFPQSTASTRADQSNAGSTNGRMDILCRSISEIKCLVTHPFCSMMITDWLEWLTPQSCPSVDSVTARHSSASALRCVFALTVVTTKTLTVMEETGGGPHEDGIIVHSINRPHRNDNRVTETKPTKQRVGEDCNRSSRAPDTLLTSDSVTVVPNSRRKSICSRYRSSIRLSVCRRRAAASRISCRPSTFKSTACSRRCSFSTSRSSR